MDIFKNTLILFGATAIITSCTGQVATDEAPAEKTKESATQVQTKTQHNYGGWYCPDNLGGFPPVDISDLSVVPVVQDRLPTFEEARNGTSLMYIDTAEYPDAHPLDIPLPQLAKYYSVHSQKQETIIVIQAVVIGTDTVVGFRFPSGGNGSSWYSEVEFFDENKEIVRSPFVFIDTVLTGTQEEIWNSFVKTTYANELGEKFDKREYFNGKWADDITTQLSYSKDDDKAIGIIMNMYGALYAQIDYTIDSKDYTEKIFFMTQAGNNSTRLHVVAGPITESFEEEKEYWNKFLGELKGNWFSLPKPGK
ncbi:MAG: hypothetical protein AAGC47_07170 [Bacteroidota bacterium]